MNRPVDFSNREWHNLDEEDQLKYINKELQDSNELLLSRLRMARWLLSTAQPSYQDFAHVPGGNDDWLNKRDEWLEENDDA